MANNKQKEDVLDETIKQFKETNWTEFILPDGSKYWWNTMNNKTTRVNPFEKAETAQGLSSSSSANEQKTDSLLKKDNSQIEISDNTTNESDEKEIKDMPESNYSGDIYTLSDPGFNRNLL
jgi:hypothetical protein